MNNLLSNIRHNQNMIFKFVLIGLTIAAISFILPRAGSFKFEYREGKPWLNEDLIAPFDFPIYKEEAEIKKEEESIRSSAKLYFKYNSELTEKKIEQFKSEFEKEWDRSSVANNELNQSVKRFFKRVTGSEEIIADESDFEAYGIQLLTDIYDKGIIKLDDIISDKPNDFEFVLLKQNVGEDKTLGDFYTIKKAFEQVERELDKKDKNVKQFLQPLIENVLTHNVMYDENITNKILEDALSSVSLSRGKINNGENIIRRGDIVSAEKVEILDSFKREYMEKQGRNSDSNYVLVGQIVLVSIMIFILVGFLYLFRNDIFMENDKIAFILFIVGAMAYLAYISIAFDKISIYILPFCVLPILMRTFFDVRLAIFTHIVSTLITGFMAPNSFEFIFLQIVAGLSSIYFIVNIRKRSQIFVTSIIIFLAYTLTYLGFSIIHEGNPQTLEYENIGWFGVSAMITLTSYPLMYVFEKTFSFITDVTLMELADTNSPLLRRLAEEAPGTFQHSLQVANLAESATHKVGGNPLLIRTAALYHDIGKMNNPAFFIENQSGINPHDELNDPKRSSQIIIQHVIDGIEMAKKNGLPEEIIDFIRTHHGTSVTGYFYKTYKQLHPEENVDRKLFAYPGPTPFSKETAILMMADAVEAASRSLQKPDEESIKTLVETIIDHQAIEEQFVNADITFKDISEIKKIFIKKLMNIYHVRIEYPK